MKMKKQMQEEEEDVLKQEKEEDVLVLSSNFPEDLIICEILPHLPIKSLIKFSLLSKTFFKAIPPFINGILSRQSHSFLYLELIMESKDSLSMFSIHDDDQSEFRLPTSFLQPPSTSLYTSIMGFQILGSSNRLLCGMYRGDSKGIFVCKPFTRCVVEIPQHPNADQFRTPDEFTAIKEFIAIAFDPSKPVFCYTSVFLLSFSGYTEPGNCLFGVFSSMTGELGIIRRNVRSLKS